jgi:hypothetical protein
MSYPIDFTIPAANSNPSNDQPKMQKNFQNINGFLSVDHVAPGSVGDGFHKEVTLYTLNPPASAPAGTTSVVFSDEGTASTVPQLYFQNSNSIFQISPIRAFGVIQFLNLTSAPVFLNQFGFSSMTLISVGPPFVFQVNFNPKVVNGIFYAVFINPNGNDPTIYNFSIRTRTPTAFQIALSGTSFLGTAMNMLVLQA